ncbi:MAG TPA: keto-deoxy-phosphogluconate aldolase, partial [Propionibacteriaceae bacterium]|nr:keto-deoxy-phosphogluconate aldolase [Propionibacteriaceae bacterium]
MLSHITRYRIVPVVVCSDAAQADALGEALVRGGLPIAEVTFRTAAAAETIRTLARRDDLLVGA